MKKIYSTPVASIEEFEANEYVAACYKVACLVGQGKQNPVTKTVWPIQEEQAGVSHSASGSGNCSDANSNYITVNADGTLRTLKEWRSDMNTYLQGSAISWTDMNGDKKCGGGDYIQWNTTAADGRVWHHWGYAIATDSSSINRS